MKKILLPFLCSLLFAFYSCQKNHPSIKEAQRTTIADPILKKIQARGFSTHGVIKTDGGYIVEGDIFLSTDTLNKEIPVGKSNIAETKHYSTNNLVTGLPRVITISTSGLSASDVQSVDVVIARYNNLLLDLTFSRVASGGEIVISSYYNNTNEYYVNAKAGTPSNGNPFNSIQLNYFRFGMVNNSNWATSIIQHELGHCIGLRHTDLHDRSYSCGGSYDNEQNSPWGLAAGANHIPGTPTGPDSESIMLACFSNSVIWSFNANDIKALKALYDQTPQSTPFNVNATAIHRYWNLGKTDHYYSQEYSTSGISGGWAYEGLVFYAFLNQPSGSVPVYRYWNNSSGNHYYEIGSPRSISGYAYEGRAFNAFNYQAPGTVPIYRYYDPSGVDHYYSTDYYPNGFGAYQWNGLVFYVYPNY